jgi:small conductance mechanosensitive channel
MSTRSTLAATATILALAIACSRQSATPVSPSVTEAAKGDAIAADVLEPPELLGVNSVTAESVTLRITARTKPGRQWAVQRTFARAALSAFEHYDIDAPYLSVLSSARSTN